MTERNISVWLFHDNVDWPEEFKFFLEHHGYHVTWLQKPSECLQTARTSAGSCDVLLIHKDLGQHVKEEWYIGIDSGTVIEEMHEVNPHARIGIISGEYPDGEKHVLQMGADFYCDPGSLNTDWLLQKLNKGWVSNEEIARRGSSVGRPPSS